MTRQEAEKRRQQWTQEGRVQCRHSILEQATVNGEYVSKNYYCVYCGEYFSAKQSSEQRRPLRRPDHLLSPRRSRRAARR